MMKGHSLVEALVGGKALAERKSLCFLFDERRAKNLPPIGNRFYTRTPLGNVPLRLALC